MHAISTSLSPHGVVLCTGTKTFSSALSLDGAALCTHSSAPLIPQRAALHAGTTKLC